MIRRCLAHIGVVTLSSVVVVVGAPGMAHADEVRDSQWYLEDLGVNDAHELSQGEGVTIGVIDSGIDATHPDLEGNVKPGKGYGDADDEALKDSREHGTNIASILAGHGHGNNNADGILGIAPKAKIVPVAMHCDDGKCAGVDPRDWWDDAFKYLMEQDVDIISASVNYSNDGSEVVTEAAEKGIPVVGSAGNSTRDYGAELGVQDNTRMSWPARAPNAIPVSGVDQDGEFWEDSIDLSGGAPQPQFGLSAPATDLPGAMPGGEYATNSGTSGAAPIVAGTLALIKSAYPNLEYEQLMERLLLTVDNKGDEGFDDEYGWGIVNPVEALTGDVEHHEGEPSTQADIVPLEDQGKGSGDGSDGEGDEEGSADSDNNPIAATTGLPMWLIIAIIAGLLIVAAAVITTVLVTQRRKKHRAGPNGPPPPPDGARGPGGPPPGPGSPPPGPLQPGPDASTTPTFAPPATPHHPQTTTPAPPQASPGNPSDVPPPHQAGPDANQAANPGRHPSPPGHSPGQAPPPEHPQAPPHNNPPGPNASLTPPQ